MLLLLALAVPVVCLCCIAVHVMSSFSSIIFCIRLRALVTVGRPCMVMQLGCTQLSSIPFRPKLKRSTCIMKALTCTMAKQGLLITLFLLSILHPRGASTGGL